MNEIDVFESLRPNVRPLSTAQVSALRTKLFGGAARVTNMLVDPAHDRSALDAGFDEPWLDGAVLNGPGRNGAGQDGAVLNGAGQDGGVLEDAVIDDLDLDAELIELTPRQREPRRWRLGAAAAAVVALGVGGIWAFAAAPDAAPAPAQQPDPSAGGTEARTPPEWYSTIRPLLPDGFDQIALTEASPEIVSFKAFRNGTRQVLDVTAILEPGYDPLKPTSDDDPTFTDEHGDYLESTSSVMLVTPDERRVSVRCALAPIGGGAVGSVSMADSARDYCGDGFDNADLDPISRRELAAHLATSLTSGMITPTFGSPAITPEATATIDAITSFVGDDRTLFPAGQWAGVLRSMSLSTDPTGPWDTELTVVHGVWAPRAADAGPANRVDGPTPPRARFHLYDDVAVAFVVADDRTGYHVLTSNLADDHLDRLGSLLDELVAAGSGDPTGEPDDDAGIAADASDVDATAVPRTDPATVDLGTTTTTLPDGPARLLDQVMNNDAVIVVNASGVAMIGQSLTDALEASGYKVLAPLSGELTNESVLYFRTDAVGAYEELAGAVGIGRGEDYRGQVVAGAVTHDQVTDANVIIVLGRDLSDAPWEAVAPPLVPLPTGRLLVLDATTTSRGSRQASDLAESLRVAGVEIVNVVPATRSLPETILVPIGSTNRWTFAVAELAGIGGFDSWTPNLYDGTLPADVTAVLVVGEDSGRLPTPDAAIVAVGEASP